MKEPSKEELQELFRSYVENMGDTPRHTDEAVVKVAEVDTKLQHLLGADDYQSYKGIMHNVMESCVEFEFSGFMAGYRAALRSKNK